MHASCSSPRLRWGSKSSNEKGPGGGRLRGLAGSSVRTALPVGTRTASTKTVDGPADGAQPHRPEGVVLCRVELWGVQGHAIYPINCHAGTPGVSKQHKQPPRGVKHNLRRLSPVHAARRRRRSESRAEAHRSCRTFGGEEAAAAEERCGSASRSGAGGRRTRGVAGMGCVRRGAAAVARRVWADGGELNAAAGVQDAGVQRPHCSVQERSSVLQTSKPISEVTSWNLEVTS